MYIYISNIFAEPTTGTLTGHILKRPFLQLDNCKNDMYK